MRKIYHLEFKATGFNFHYGDLTILCNTWSKNLGVSKFTLDRWNFEKPLTFGKKLPVGFQIFAVDLHPSVYQF